jgi:hypothetical protein
MITLKRDPRGDFLIFFASRDRYCRTLLKNLIPAYFRHYDRSLRCWVVHPFGVAQLYHFLSFADVFGPAEVRPADLRAALRAANEFALRAA